VLVLIRPETVELTPADGSGGANTLSGEVIAQTFLGPVTRLKVSGSGTNLIADMSTARAAALPVGARVIAKIPSEGAKLISLPDDGPGLPVLDPDDQ
jgi:putative spermidine/putrescine transport system ATP-binding protein